MTKEIWLVGAGLMAQAYADVLKALDYEFTVVTRSKNSASSFGKAYDIKTYSGGLDLQLQNLNVPEFAIVAVNVENLEIVAKKLIKAGCKNIMLEKPGSLDYEGVKNLKNLSKQNKCNLFIAYNRRFFASVEKLNSLIKKEEGILSSTFDFTEWSHLIEKLNTSSHVKRKWLLANSTHVIDLVFDFIGRPKKSSLNCINSGSTSWHPSASRFYGSGESIYDIPFSYHSDWESAGRWSIEIFTKYNKYILCPMEKLQVMKKGTVNVVEVDFDNKIDIDFKPGLYKQTKNFIDNRNIKENKLCTIEDHLENFLIYEEIAGYR